MIDLWEFWLFCLYNVALMVFIYVYVMLAHCDEHLQGFELVMATSGLHILKIWFLWPLFKYFRIFPGNFKYLFYTDNCGEIWSPRGYALQFLPYSRGKRLLYKWLCRSYSVLWNMWCPMGTTLTNTRPEPWMIYSPFFPPWTFRRHSDFKRSLWTHVVVFWVTYSLIFVLSPSLSFFFPPLSCFPEITTPERCYHKVCASGSAP